MKNISTWVTFVALFLALPLNILANLLTPWVQRFLAKRSIPRSRSRLEKLKLQLERRAAFENDHVALVRYIARPFLEGALGMFLSLFALAICLFVQQGNFLLASYGVRGNPLSGKLCMWLTCCYLLYGFVGLSIAVGRTKMLRNRADLEGEIQELEERLHSAQ
jgi:hypothetical protein